MVVRTFLYGTAGDPSALPARYDAAAFAPLAERLWARLNALEPSLWRAGETYPTSQAAVEQLYATGEIDAYFTYGPGTVATKVADGVFPATTREAVPSIGNIGNVSSNSPSLPTPPTGRRRWCWRTCCRTRRPSCGFYAAPGSTR